MAEPVSSGQLWQQSLAEAAKGSALVGGLSLPWGSASQSNTGQGGAAGMPRIGSGPQGWPAFEPASSRTVKVRSCSPTTLIQDVHPINVLSAYVANDQYPVGRTDMASSFTRVPLRQYHKRDFHAPPLSPVTVHFMTSASLTLPSRACSPFPNRASTTAASASLPSNAGKAAPD